MNEPFRHDQSSDRWKFQTAFVVPLRSFVLALLVSVCHQGVSWGLEVTFTFVDPNMSLNSTGTFSASGTFTTDSVGQSGPSDYFTGTQGNRDQSRLLPDPSYVVIQTTSLNGSMTINGSPRDVSSLEWAFSVDTGMFGNFQGFDFRINATTAFSFSQQAIFSFTGNFVVTSSTGTGLYDEQLRGNYNTTPVYSVVPEPGSMALGAISLAVSAATARRRKKAGQAGGRCRPESNAIRPANENCPRAESKCAGRSR